MLISDLKTRLASKIHGKSLNKVQDIDNLIYEGAGNLLLRVDPAETKRVVQIENALYDQVYSYAAPSDVKGDKIIDIRPQANRQVSDNFNNTYQQEFDIYKSNNSFTIENNSGVKTLRISKTLTSGILINDCNDLTTDGVWAVGGSAGTLAVDSVIYITGSASIKFTAAAGGTSSYIECSGMDAKDLSTIEDQGAVFAWVYIPTLTGLTSFTLRWGSSSSNYWSSTVTARHDSTALTTGWNLLRFDWVGATETGTAVSSAVNYIRFTINHTTAFSGICRFDSIMGKLGSIFEAVYYSKYLFKSTSGIWKAAPTADDDEINLDVDSYNLLVYEVAYLVAQELQGSDSTVDVEFYKGERDAAYKLYGGTYKSNRQKPRVPYYRMR